MTRYRSWVPGGVATDYTSMNADDDENYCYDDVEDSYAINSQEWNSVAYREGFAHFVSARVWNNKSPRGSFRWLNNKTYDLERYGPSYDGSSANGAGGLLENVCDGTLTGAGTAEDVLRFLWDFYNADSGLYCVGNEQPSAWDIARVYVRARVDGGLLKSNYATKMETAAQNIGIYNCLADSGSNDEYNYYQEHNGVEH